MAAGIRGAVIGIVSIVVLMAGAAVVGLCPPDGPVTYSAAAADLDDSAPNEVELWDALDYIGFEWYLPLTDEQDISLPELVALERAAIEDLARFLHERYDKPLLLTESASVVNVNRS